LILASFRQALRPLSPRMVGEMLAARGVPVTHETVRQWGLKIRAGIREAWWRRMALRRGRHQHREPRESLRRCRDLECGENGSRFGRARTSTLGLGAARLKRSRRRERKMQRFKSMGSAQRFLSFRLPPATPSTHRSLRAAHSVQSQGVI
jgi:transposase-like protein